GPTEAAVAVTCWKCDRAWNGTGPLPIGKPIANTSINILDPHLEPVPVGVPGELCIGGVQLGLGYLNRPELTAERFVPDPFSGVAGARMYRTGDRARWLPDGTIEFLGRIDHQVKVRGYRIEPGEIESVLAAQEGVSAAVVLPITANGSLATAGVADALIAFVVPENAEKPVDSDELRRALQAQLPRFMLPARIVAVDHIPLTPNGKTDRKALLALDPGPAAPAATLDARQAPSTPEEELLAGIFAEVLGLEKVGIHDDFFELGGHSLLATQVVSRIRSAFGLDVPVRSLFETPTVAGLARHLAELRRQHDSEETEPPIVPLPRDGTELPLSFAQQRLWFLYRLEPESTAYNISGAMRVRGTLDTNALERSFGEVVRRHESLRTTFHEVDGRPVQRIH